MELKADEQLDLIGSRVSVLAKRLGLTQEEVASRLKISRITINRFFKGRTEIRSGDLVQLLMLFGIDIEKLVEERLERVLKGKSLQPSLEHQATPKMLEQLDPNVGRTIIEQLNWWQESRKVVGA